MYQYPKWAQKALKDWFKVRMSAMFFWTYKIFLDANWFNKICTIPICPVLVVKGVGLLGET